MIGAPRSPTITVVSDRLVHVVSPLVAGFPFALIGLIIGVGPGCSLLAGGDPINLYNRFIWFSVDKRVSRGIL